MTAFRNSNGRGVFILTVALLGLLNWTEAQIVPARADELIFPEDVFRPYYFVDVTKAPYNIDNTGREDVTEKLRTVIADIFHGGLPALRQKTLYFPDGTYRISDTLDTIAPNKAGKMVAVHRLLWVGQSRDKTILKLDDNLPAFQDPKNPRAMIKTESIGNNGNDAYTNGVTNMTLDVGAGNPGAAGLSYLANNTGELRDVCIRAGKDSGFAGLLMNRQWPGPAFVKNLEVDGFDYGVQLTRMEYSITFEHLVLKDQRKAGFQNIDNAAFIRDLQSTNTVPAIENNSLAGLVVLIDSKLSGGDAQTPAVHNGGGVFLRNVLVEGYGNGVLNTVPQAGPAAPAGNITEYTSYPVITCKGFPDSRTTSLNLEIRETPQFADNDFSNWYCVGKKAQPDAGNTDQADAIQAAIDEAAASGKTTFYFIPGQYIIGHTLTFHGSIRRVLGFGSVFRMLDNGAFKKADGAVPAVPPTTRKDDYGAPVFKVTDLQGDDIEFNQFCLQTYFSAVGKVNCYGFLQDTPKTVILRGFQSDNIVYRSSEGAGDLFIETGVGNGWLFEHPGQKIWARQLDPEGDASPKVINVGSRLWVLGLKTERPGIQVDSSKGAETEILGGLFYPVKVPNDDPIFRVDNSSFSGSYVTVDNTKTPDFPRQLLEIRGTQEQVIHPEDTYPRPCFGGAKAALVPLVVAAPAGSPAPGTK